jgi:predicted nucleic acid-binding protein
METILLDTNILIAHRRAKGKSSTQLFAQATWQKSKDFGVIYTIKQQQTL